LLGKRGFLQYHFVLPEKHAAAISEIFNEVQKSTVTPFFVILHSYGSAVSPGFMSFPLEGLGGTLDCLNDGQTTVDLFRRLDTILIRLGGRVYPAKDSAMTPATYQHYFPRWQELAQYRDPKFSSTFWRRVTAPDRLS
jgi:FAD/FMN-containing dehydrogenase